MISPEEQKILNDIIEASLSAQGTRFPVSETKRIMVPGFDNVWVKDESTNETGTHKDRMAWEIVAVYADILKTKARNSHLSEPLPKLSLISAGSAALAVQTKLKRFNLPNLKVLADISVKKEAVEALESLGCDVYQADLSGQMLSSEDILKLTDNINGFDITSNKGFDPTIRFYDWLSYEILNENPDYVFAPFGTGQLYENIINIAKYILTSETCDKVYSGDKEKIRQCHFIGATSNNPKTKAVKLYAPFRPFTSMSQTYIDLLARRGYCGTESRIVEVTENSIESGYKLLNNQGIQAEYSGASAMGLLLQLQKEIPPQSKIIIINTGKAKFGLN